MSHLLANLAVIVAQFVLLVAMAIALVRILRGPHAQDRVLALDALYIDAMLLLLTIGLRTGSLLYVEAALAISLVGFAASSALARFLLRGEVIE